MTEETYSIGAKQRTLKELDIRQMVAIMDILVDSIDDSSSQKREAAKSHLKSIIQEIKLRLGGTNPYIIIFNKDDNAG